MNNQMYSKENLDYLKKKQKLYLILSIAFVVLFVAAFFLFLFLTTREYEKTLKFIGVVTVVVLICAFIFALSLTLDFARKVNQFEQIYKDEGVIVKGKYLGRKEYTVTLQDRSIVYELSFMTNEGEKIYYLVSLFDYPFIKEENYSLRLVSEFIKEASHEE